ncbi:cytochrome P450 [Aspergillus stella-maris]|uniref:cytochrome P450 n=1 Tax=Aspergillus stella-maris TaxID=1810926 RepID=UPI003CCE523F
MATQGLFKLQFDTGNPGPAILVSIAATILVARFLHHYFRLWSVPGPLVASFTDLWFAYHVWKGTPGLILLDLHAKYGPMVRIGPNRLSLGDPKGIPVLYRTKPIQVKGPFYRFGVDFSNPDSLSIGNVVDEQLHSTLKRPIAPLFSMATSIDMETKLEEKHAVFISHIQQKAIVDISSWSSYWAIDTLNHVAFSDDLGYMDNEMDVGDVLAKSKSISRDMQWFYILPWVKRLQIRMRSCFGSGDIVGNPLIPLAVSRVAGRLEDRQSGVKHRGDLLDRLVQVSDSHPDTYGMERLVATTLLLIFSGSDSTSATVAFTIYYLVKHPHILQKLETEILTAQEEGRLSNPPKWTDISKLDYLGAVLKEALRLSSVVKHGMDREIGPGGIQLCGYNLPPGTTVTAWQQTIHYNADLYGKDAQDYRPERWLEATPERRQAMEHLAIWFGHGKHVCSGQHLARVNMSKLLVQMVQNFQISDTNPQAQMEAVKISALGTPSREYFVTFKKRVGHGFSR